MNPQSPVVPDMDIPEIVFAKDQPQYIPLPVVYRHNGEVLSRWKLTWRERLRVLWTGNLYLTVCTFHAPLQPARLSTCHWWSEPPGGPFDVAERFDVRQS